MKNRRFMRFLLYFRFIIQYIANADWRERIGILSRAGSTIVLSGVDDAGLDLFHIERALRAAPESRVELMNLTQDFVIADKIE
jgi:hypothetical protein